MRQICAKGSRSGHKGMNCNRIVAELKVLRWEREQTAGLKTDG